MRLLRAPGARRGRNPKTGDPVDIPAKRVPYFKPGKELKELINEDENGAGGADAAASADPPDPDARPVEPPQPDARTGDGTSSENGESGGGQTPPLM